MAQAKLKMASMLARLTSALDGHGKMFWAVTGGASIALVGVVDFLTGYELAFSLFYLVPIVLVAWYAGKELGLVASGVSALVWLGADIYAGNPVSIPAVFFWNSLIRLSFFVIVTLLISSLHAALEREKALARIDLLTGAVNGRFFGDLLQMEINRLQRYRHPFTLAYLDLDNFKAINDTLGHSTGDRVLAVAVQHAKAQLRKTDVVARLGGDEFVLLLPETGSAAAQAAIAKVQSRLLEAMRQNNWPVTCSIGVLTCLEVPETTDELIRQADALMYFVKKNGKNAVMYAVYPDRGEWRRP